ncbi:MAG: porin family protein [Gammaproteobacteria bacterium]|nr:porin family protein [Gammaproteobacteria bacterium]
MFTYISDHFCKEASFLVLTLYLLTGATAHAATEFIPFTGYRASGDFEETSTDTTLSVRDEESYGFVINIDAGSDTQYDLLYSKQSSSLQAGAIVPNETLFDINIEYLHLGGTKLYSIGNNTNTFFGAGLGFARFDPKVDGYSSESKFSFNLSGGVKGQLSKSLGVRLGFTWLATPVSDESAIFCGGSAGGCTVHFKGGLFSQFETSIGMIFRFD